MVYGITYNKSSFHVMFPLPLSHTQLSKNEKRRSQDAKQQHKQYTIQQDGSSVYVFFFK